MKFSSKVAATIGLAGAAALVLASCSSAEGSPETADGLMIVTTTTQVNDFVTNVTAGTGASVTSLLQSGESAHSYEPDAADLLAISQADLVVASGYGLEAWLDDTIAAAGYTGAILHAADGFDAASLHESPGHGLAATGGADEQADDGHDHADEAADAAATDDGHDHAGEAAGATATDDGHDHADDGHDHADDGHDHGDVDPHVWSSPVGGEYMVSTITEAAATADPANAETYRANGAAYQEKLVALDTWIGENIAQVPAAARLLVTNHHALTYYADEFHITIVGSIMPSWDDNAEPSAQELDALISNIRASGATAVFSETQLSAATAERIASETGVRVYSGDQALSTDALGATGTPTATYIGATVHNTMMLLDSWGAAPSDLPAELQGA